MANTKVTGDLIASSTIATGNIADNAVTSDKISGITTAHITEGSNLYYTNARARGAVSVSGNALAYNSSTGVITSNFEESPVFTGIITANSSSSGDYVRLYGSSGTGKWDIYGNGANLRISDNESAGILVVDTGATFGGDVVSNAIAQANGFRTTTGSTDYSLLTRNSTNTAVYIQQAGTGNIVDFRYGSQAAGQGTSAMLIKSNGNVGISNTSPTEKLHIINASGNTNIRVHDSSSNSEVGLQLQNDAKTWQLQNWGSGGDNLRILNNAGNTIQLWDDNGNVGIGTTTPLSKLTVSEGTNQHGIELAPGTLSYLQCYDRATSTYGNMTIDAKYLAFGLNNGAEKIRFTADGYVGIGLTNPSWQLEVSNTGTVRHAISSTNNGTAGVFFRVFNSGTQVGNGTIRTDNAGTMSFWTGTTGESIKMAITSGGNVGIGTTSPSSYNSRGRNLVLSGSGDVGISIDCSSANSGTLLFADGTGGTAGYRGSIEYDHATDHMAISTAATERMRIDSVGDVKMGSTSRTDARFKITGANSGTNPAATAHMASAVVLYNAQGSDGSFSGIDFNNSSDLVDSRIVGIHTSHTSRTGALAFLTHNGTSLGEKMRIDSSGHILMGKTSGSYRLDMETVAGGNAFRTTRGTSSYRIFQANNGASFMGTENDADLNIQTNSATRVTITSAGKAEFGNLAGTGNGRHLIVNSFSYTTLMQGTSTSNIFVIRNGTGLSANVGMILFESNAGGASGQITTNSSTNTTSYNTSGSDERLKKNITDWNENVLDKFKDIQPKKFHFKTQNDDSDKIKGYIAQNEVDKFPEAYPLVEDKESGEKRYVFNPSGMNVYLMKAIQELKAEIEILKNK